MYHSFQANLPDMALPSLLRLMMVSGQPLGEQYKKIRVYRSPEVMKMESMRHLWATSLLDRALACLLQLMMVSGQLLGSTTRRLETSRCIGTTSGEHVQDLAFASKDPAGIIWALTENYYKFKLKDIRCYLVWLVGEWQDFNTLTRFQYMDKWARACCMPFWEQHGETENEWLTSW